MSGRDIKMKCKLTLKILFNFYLNIYGLGWAAGEEVITAYLLSKVKVNNKSSTPFFMKITVKEMLGGAVLCLVLFRRLT